MKKIILYLSISCALILSSSAAKAQMILDLNSCKAMAVDSNKQILAAKLLQEKTVADKNAIRAKFLPQFSGYGMYYYTTNLLRYAYPGGNIPAMGMNIPIPPMNLDIDMANTFTVGVSVKQPVFMGLKIVSAYQMTKIGIEMSALNSKKTKSEVIVEVEDAYWTYVKTCQLVKASESFRETVDGVEKFGKNAVELGMATETDLLKVQVQLNNAKLLQSKAKNGKALAKMNLCSKIGLPLHADIDVDKSEFEVVFNIDSITGAVTDRYDYQLLDKQTQLKHKQLALVRSDFLPQLGVMASYGYSNGLKLMDEKLLNSDSFSAIASLKIPIFSWGEGAYKIKSAKKEYEISMVEKEKLAEMMSLEQAKYKFAVTDAQYLVDLTKSSLKNAESNLKVSKDQYELGMETLPNVLEAQTQWQKATSDYIEAIAEYRLSFTKYLKSIGQL